MILCSVLGDVLITILPSNRQQIISSSHITKNKITKTKVEDKIVHFFKNTIQLFLLPVCTWLNFVIMIWKYKSRITVKLRVSDIITTGVNIKFVILLASCFTIMKNISFFKIKMTYCFSLLIMFVGHGRICWRFLQW